ncbi:MAG: hypothetical protein ACK5LV_08910 [Lachnospirales bacterium]
MKKASFFIISMFILALATVITYSIAYESVVKKDDDTDSVREDLQTNLVLSNENVKPMEEVSNSLITAESVGEKTDIIEDVYQVKLNKDATLHFRKKYKNGTVKEYSVEIPEYLIGEDEEVVSSYFEDFEVESFDTNDVFFIQEVNAESYYLLGEKDGYIQVFFVDVDENVYEKERINTPTSSLSEKDKELISNGIRCDDEESLMMTLENYDS